MSQMRLPQLDVLRAVCVFLVLGRHLSPAPPENGLFLHKFTLYWNYGGWIGVDIFFVLSGFLVSGLIFQEYKKSGGVKAGRFLIRRGFKIYPSFYLMIFATVLVNFFLDKNTPLIPLIAEIFFVQNLIFGRLWFHTWSLAVEEHFYIGLAILTFFILRFRKAAPNPFSYIPPIFALLAVICFSLRALMAVYKGTNISPTPFRIDSLFFGVFLSYLWHFRNLAENTYVKKFRYALIFAGILLFLPMFFFMSVTNAPVFVFGLTTNYIAAGLILLGLLKIDLGKSRLIVSLAYIGKFSYSIYLWHLPVQDWLAIPLKNYFGGSWFLYAGFYLLGSILIGVVLSKIIEYPILRIRDNLPFSKVN